ncbi:MAG TPA: DUF3426 domain-containing protein, partial [Steroidobacteraceae bacterium]
SDDHGIDDEEDLEFDPRATDVTEVFIEPTQAKDEASGTFESIILRAEEGTLPDEEEEPARIEQPRIEDDELSSELRELAARLSSTGQGEKAEVRRPAVQTHLPAANDESIVPVKPAAPPASAAIEPDEEESELAPRSARAANIAWASGTAALILVLLAQIVHHYRNDLAVHPRLHGPLTSFYASLGMPLSPNWDLSGYEVRQLGAETEPDAGRLTVRASLKNASGQPQPMPLLRVTVQDRYGNRIASNDVAPSVYLPRAIPASSLLAVGQRIDAEMAFIDPGAQAVGFEIDACLPTANGGVACANDAVSR